MKTENQNADYFNLRKINDNIWKHKITVTTSLRSNHANVFGKHKLCGCFAKVIVRHQRKFNNNPIGFVSFEYTSGDNLHFHSIWSELVNIDEIDNILEVSNVQNNLLSGYNAMDGWGYRAIDKQVCGYIPKNKYGADWLGYITKKNSIFVYYTPSLIKEIKGANVAIEKINDQNGLVDHRNIHLFKYLSKDRRSRHESEYLKHLEIN